MRAEVGGWLLNLPIDALRPAKLVFIFILWQNLEAVHLLIGCEGVRGITASTNG